jgi:hypothetical protein
VPTCLILSDLSCVNAIWDKSARVRRSWDEIAQTLEGRIGVVGQQRGALLARGSTVKRKKPNDERDQRPALPASGSRVGQ